MSDFSSVSDENLKASIEDWQNALKKAEQDAEKYRRYISVRQAELDRRQLAAFWEANPGLLRLEVGSELIVTREFIEEKRRTFLFSPSQMSAQWVEGKCATVESIDLKDGWVRFDEGGLTGGVSFDVLQTMRKAYLAQQEQMT